MPRALQTHRSAYNRMPIRLRHGGVIVEVDPPLPSMSAQPIMSGSPVPRTASRSEEQVLGVTTRSPLMSPGRTAKPRPKRIHADRRVVGEAHAIERH